MRRTIFAGLLTLIAVACINGQSQAQLQFKPIDTDALIIQPVDTATSIVGGTFRYVSRVVANTLNTDGMVRTVNNLFGREATPPGYQQGPSALPLAGSYPGANYPSGFGHVMPRYQNIRR